MSISVAIKPIGEVLTGLDVATPSTVATSMAVVPR
jgi:hypothetical protein